jgi:hypothetical protein
LVIIGKKDASAEAVLTGSVGGDEQVVVISPELLAHVSEFKQ